MRTDRRISKKSLVLVTSALACLLCAGAASAADTLPPINERFAAAEGDETPSFQRHVVPLFGQLGCNGRACHGSFKGQGGFRLSLFGYDFKADHAALTEQKDELRIDVDDVDESLVLNKPTDEFNHEGGLRYKKDSWQYHVFRRWIEAGAQYAESDVQRMVALELTPREVVFKKEGETVQLKAVAVWPDGTREDVTTLCRFQTNNDQCAKVTEGGLVAAVKPGDTHVVVFYDNGVVPVPVMRPVSKLAGPKYPKVDTPTKVDQLVVEKLRKLGIVPSELSSDSEFLRRVSLDLTGTLPAPEEVEAFVADTASDKRSRKVDELLELPAYAAWWTTKLCDLTGNNDDALRNASPIRGRASEDWYNWILRRVAENKPYDELVAGIVVARSRQPDQSYTEFSEEMSAVYRGDDGREFADLDTMPHFWARRDFRDPEPRAISFAHAFMGIRIQCAQCHKHPFDQWSKEDFAQFSRFFTGVVASNRAADKDSNAEYQKIVEALGVADKKGNQLYKEMPAMLKAGKTIPFPEVAVRKPVIRLTPEQRKKQKRGSQVVTSAKLLGGDEIDLTAHEDIRQPLMEWLRSPDNQFFARAWVNRVWAAYFNVGIVEPADDMSLANPPSNKPLLDHLTQGFIESGYDMKWLHRTIANSRTYQLGWQPNDTNLLDERNFSRAVPRRLPAEVTYDAVWQATASDEQVAERQTDLDGRAISIPGASARYGRQSGPGYALMIFGRSTRDNNCDCDRSMEPSLLQTVFLQNDQEIFGLIDRRDGGWIDQVAVELGLKSKSKGKASSEFQKNISKLNKQMQKARKNGDKDKIKKLQRKIAELRRQYPPSRAKVEKLDLADDKLDAIIRSAYLRTVSRAPSDDELARSRSFIRESEDTLSGVRGLLWALLNTKEFIVNH